MSQRDRQFIGQVTDYIDVYTEARGLSDEGSRLSHLDTVSPRGGSPLDLRFRRRKLTRRDRIRESTGAVRAVGEQAEGPALGIEQLEIALDANGTIVAHGYLGRRHSSLPNSCRQYLGTEGSTSSDHARIPPLRFKILRKPALRRKSTASAERLPLRQCATISREESSSCTRRGSSPSGIRCPLRLQIWNSCGSRTSKINKSSPRSRRDFSSRGVISGTCTFDAGASSPRTPQNS